MGQQSGLEDAYLKLSEEELLEGDSKHAGYVDIIDHKPSLDGLLS